MIFNHQSGGGGTRLKNITFTLDFSLSETVWKAAYYSVVDGQSVWTESEENVISLSEIQVQSGSPIIVMVSRQGTEPQYEGEGQVSKVTLADMDLFSILPVDYGSGVFTGF